MRSEILGLIFKTLTANCENSCSNKDNLPLPIQMQLSKKPKIFCCAFYAFLGYKLNFQCFEEKVSPIGHVFLKLLTPEDVLT